MAFDQTKPATTDNYSTAFVPGIQANFLALAMWLDSNLSSITGTIPTGAKRYNRTSGRIEEYSGSAWGNLTVNVNTADAATNMPYSGLTGAVPTWNQNTTGNAGSATTLVQNAGTYTHLGTWGAANTAAGTFLVNRAYRSDICDGNAASSSSCSGNAASASSCSGDAARSRGLTRSDSAVDGYNVQSHWDGSYWQLKGYANTTYHAGVRVAYADTAGSAGSASTAGSCTGNAATASIAANALGVGQSWASVLTTPGRASGGTYTSPASRTIVVTVGLTAVSASPGGTLVIGGVTVATWVFPYGTGNPITFVVPPNTNYQLTINPGTTIAYWSELR